MKKFNLFNLLGVGFLIAALYLCHGAVTEYAADVAHQDWTQTTAIVTGIGSREIRSSGRKHTRYRTVYDITYTYEAEGSAYEGQVTGTQNFRVHGEQMPIKYDPASPADSTATLEPSLYDLIVPLIAAAVFGVIGFFTSGLWAFFHNRRIQDEPPEPPEAFRPEEPEPIPADGAGKVGYHLKRILILVVFIGFMVGFVYFGTHLGPEKEPVTADTVEALLLERGYAPQDATAVYADAWKMQLEEVLCVNEDGLLLLFVETDNDTAKNLVNKLYSFSLDEIAPEPEAEYRYSGRNFIVHVMENAGRYAMHIRVGETLAYVQCAEERAAEAAGLLNAIGYYH